ncbi:MAG TPA: hypothetical protein DHV96_04860 [Lachnospiraceae bacterium]|nr:hypothetical protein [Lachnospiraceae bacterium]
MEKSIQGIAKEVRAHSGSGRRYANICFVVSILAGILFMVFHDNELTKTWLAGHDILLVLETGCFTYWFYRSYLMWQLPETYKNLKMEAEISEWMRVHNISIKEYFHYVAGKLLPYQMILLAAFLVCALLSDRKLRYIGVTIACIAVSFLIGYLYLIYYYKKVQSRSNFFGFAFLHGVFLYVVYMINFGIMLLAAFVGYGVISDVGSTRMPDGETVVRGVGESWMFITFILSAIFFIFVVVFCPVFSGRLAKWRTAVSGTLFAIVVASALISILAGRLWYEEINYTRQEILVVHGKEQVYSFSDVTDYSWDKIDPNDTESEEKALVLHLSDRTVVDIMNQCAYTVDQGDYEKEALAYFPQK